MLKLLLLNFNTIVSVFLQDTVLMTGYEFPEEE